MTLETPIFPIEKCQKVLIPQGAIYLGPSDKNRSVGYLELNPHTSLTLHNRPAIESLTQIKGKSNMVVYKQDMEGKIISMDEEDHLEISPANTWHIHVNPFDQISLQYWDFQGDITEVVLSIKKMAENSP